MMIDALLNKKSVLKNIKLNFLNFNFHALSCSVAPERVIIPYISHKVWKEAIFVGVSYV